MEGPNGQAHDGQAILSAFAASYQRGCGVNASDIMVRDVITVRPDDNVAYAADLLVKHDISALPVIDEYRHVLGILSEADLLRRQELSTEKRRPWWLEAVTPASALAMDYTKAHGQRVGELMSAKVVTASADASLQELATLLERHRIKRVPIVEQGRLVGVVSRANLIQALASAPALTHQTTDCDHAIRDEILARLAEQRWTGFGERNVVVSDGVVHLWGLVGSPEERTALLALAESTPSVRRVADEMIASY